MSDNTIAPMGDELPPLPKPLIEHRATFATIRGYSADQMREYGRLCAEQERERAARICEELMRKDIGDLPDVTWRKARYSGLYEAAEAIRAQGGTK